MFFCSYINFELVEQIIAILGLIITTKSGIEFFINGKNLTRLQKLINRFSYKNSIIIFMSPNDISKLENDYIKLLENEE